MIAYYALVAVLALGIVVMAVLGGWSTIVVRRDRQAEYGAPIHHARHSLRK